MVNSMYGDLAKYYDLIYSWKNYKNESKRIKQLILKYKKVMVILFLKWLAEQAGI